MKSLRTTIERLDRRLDEIVFDRPGGLSLEDLRVEYHDRPEAFLRDVLHVEQLWQGQLDIIEAIKNQRQVAVVSGQGLSKTYTVARLALWFLYTRENALVIALAPGERQLRLIFFKEVREAMLGAPDLPGKMFSAIDHGLVLADSHKLIGFSTAPGAGMAEGKLIGHHARNLMVIAEESETIEEWVWRGIARLSPGPDARVVAVGNPSEPAGHWYNLHRGAPENGWFSLRLDASTHPNIVHRSEVIPGAITQTWIDDVKATYGENSAFYKSAVLGQFVAGAPDALIAPALWERADRIYRKETGRIEGEARQYRKVCALDVAAETGTNALAIVQGPKFIALETWHEPDMLASISILKERLKEHKLRVSFQQPVASYLRKPNSWGIQKSTRVQPFILLYDAVGVGWSVGSVLRDSGWVAHSFKGSRSPAERAGHKAPTWGRNFASARTEAAWVVREGLMNGRLAVPYTEELVEEGSVRFSVDMDGKIRLELKQNLVGRIGRSPDRLDALAMAYWHTYTQGGVMIGHEEPVRW